MEPIGDRNTVKARLLLAGYNSVKDWADEKGHNPLTVYRTIRIWGERKDRPLGGLGRQIMADLRQTLSGEKRAA